MPDAAEDEWKVYGPNAPTYCPACKKQLGYVGHHFRFRVRVNKAGTEAPPSHGVAYTERCRNRACKVNLERELLSA